MEVFLDVVRNTLIAVESSLFVAMHGFSFLSFDVRIYAATK